MSDNKEENSTGKKLSLGKKKLSLGAGYSSKLKLNKPSSLVVEVTKGKASSKSSVIIETGEAEVNTEQAARRLAALQRAQNSLASPAGPTASLSKLAEINQKPEELAPELDKVIEETEQVQPLEESVSASQVAAPKAEPKDLAKDVEITNAAKSTLKAKAASDTADGKKLEEELYKATKVKGTEPKKLKKTDLLHMLDADGEIEKTRSLASIKRARDKERRKNEGKSKVEKLYREVILPEVITVADLANQMSERSADVIRELMKMGVMATANQSIDADTAELIASGLGHRVKRVSEADIENVLFEEDAPELLIPRAPIVTVMGHVDHGKTSLLDALKSTDIAAGEAGGITQHIGAYSVKLSGDKMITFIDTPGHEAFTEMRTRGAQVTDIVVLVVAADDGIKAQTVEAINHAKAAKVPIIVAINKIDKPDADLDRVKNELLSHELVPEDLGGDIITVGVSAKERRNLDKLEEAILLVAEMQELKANPNTTASGTVIEARIDKAKGVVATVIVQRGTLEKSNIILAGTSSGRIKRLVDDKGRNVLKAGPSLAVEVFGLNDAPQAGDKFNIVESDKQARDIIAYRQKQLKNTKVTAAKVSLQDLFDKASGENKIKELPLIIKGDVHGSIEAIVGSLSKIESDEVKIKILHSAVGGVLESDITLAEASGAVVLGFNVRANNAAAEKAERDKVDIRYYSIIYNLIDDIKAIMSGLLSPIIREKFIGTVDIREVFNITKVGKIAGSYVTKGVIKRGAGVRLLRENIVIHEGTLKTLKRFKDDVKEVREGYECGIAFDNYEDIKVGDKVEVFEIIEEKKQL